MGERRGRGEAEVPQQDPQLAMVTSAAYHEAHRVLVNAAAFLSALSGLADVAQVMEGVAQQYEAQSHAADQRSQQVNVMQARLEALQREHRGLAGEVERERAAAMREHQEGMRELAAQRAEVARIIHAQQAELDALRQEGAQMKAQMLGEAERAVNAEMAHQREELDALDEQRQHLRAEIEQLEARKSAVSDEMSALVRRLREG